MLVGEHLINLGFNQCRILIIIYTSDTWLFLFKNSTAYLRIFSDRFGNSKNNNNCTKYFFVNLNFW